MRGSFVMRLQSGSDGKKFSREKGEKKRKDTTHRH